LWKFDIPNILKHIIFFTFLLFPLSLFNKIQGFALERGLGKGMVVISYSSSLASYMEEDVTLLDLV
jgi:hypothetical protein